MLKDAAQVLGCLSIEVVLFQVEVELFPYLLEGGLFGCADILCDVRIFSSGVVVDVGVEHSEDVCDHPMLFNFDSGGEVAAVYVGEPDLDLSFFIDGDLLLINTEVSDNLAELHVPVDAGLVEMKYVRVGDVLHLGQSQSDDLHEYFF